LLAYAGRHAALPWQEKVSRMQIEINIDPVIFSVGGFELRWYSLAIMVSIVVATWFIAREFRRKGIDDSNYSSVALIAIASGILGARLLHVFDDLGYYLDHPGKILDFQSGGLAIYGAVIGGFIGVVIGTRIYKLPLLPVIDAVAPGLVLAQAIGRFGCIVNGDAWGAQTDSPFAFIYTNPDSFIPNRLLGVPTHPYPVYDMVMNLAIFGVLMWLRKKPLPDGALFALFVTLYGFGRFFISYVREERVWFWGLQEAQVIAIVAMVAGAAALAWLFRNRPVREERAMQLETAG
jgi:phosphatidylglycerol:prolipoprotein diacylglycerol transferase